MDLPHCPNPGAQPEPAVQGPQAEAGGVGQHPAAVRQATHHGGAQATQATAQEEEASTLSLDHFLLPTPLTAVMT